MIETINPNEETVGCPSLPKLTLSRWSRLNRRNQANYKTMIHFKCDIYQHIFVIRLKLERTMLYFGDSTGCCNSRTPFLLAAVWIFPCKIHQFDVLHYDNIQMANKNADTDFTKVFPCRTVVFEGMFKCHPNTYIDKLNISIGQQEQQQNGRGKNSDKHNKTQCPKMMGTSAASGIR